MTSKIIKIDAHKPPLVVFNGKTGAVFEDSEEGFNYGVQLVEPRYYQLKQYNNRLALLKTKRGGAK